MGWLLNDVIYDWNLNGFKKNSDGESFVVWTGLAGITKSWFAAVKGRNDQLKYIETLKKCPLPFATEISAVSWRFMQDGASRHGVLEVRKLVTRRRYFSFGVASGYYRLKPNRKSLEYHGQASMRNSNALGSNWVAERVCCGVLEWHFAENFV